MTFVESFPPHDEKDLIYGVNTGMQTPYCIVKMLFQDNKLYVAVVIYEQFITSEEVLEKYAAKLSKRGTYCIPIDDTGAKHIYAKNSFLVVSETPYIEKCFKYLSECDIVFLNEDSMLIFHEWQYLQKAIQDISLCRKLRLRILRSISLALPTAVKIEDLSY